MIRATKGHQGLGKWESSATLIRVVRELLQMLEDGIELEKGDDDQVMNAIYDFQATLPKKVRDDLLHG